MKNRPSTLPGTPKVKCALAVAREHPEELGHLEQVARLALVLFADLRPLHKMGSRERDLLCCAALLHDIGISVSYPRHHKHSLRLIRESDLPALTAGEREVVANIARYHRKARPKPKHEAFRALDGPAQSLVRRLAAILRVADGLDRAHENAVAALEAAAVAPARWIIRLYGTGDLAYAAWGAERKATLFEEVYGVELGFEAKGPPKQRR